jgi:hypothetical protein
MLYDTEIPWVDGNFKMQGWTQLLLHPWALILRMGSP